MPAAAAAAAEVTGAGGAGVFSTKAPQLWNLLRGAALLPGPIIRHEDEKSDFDQPPDFHFPNALFLQP